jgi:methionyl-tRNA synthetase
MEPAADGGAAAAPADPSGERFCVTTAINYANGLPHMGHAYEAVSADAIARYHRAYGRQVRQLPAAPPAGCKQGWRARERG